MNACSPPLAISFASATSSPRSTGPSYRRRAASRKAFVTRRARRRTMRMDAAIPSATPARATVHWPEALMEGLGLGLFMVSAGAFGTLFEYPGSPVRQMIPDAFVRRVLMGAAMGATAIALIYSPWGRRSGAHINPATTLTFLRLGRVRGRDALAYLVAQIAGGLLGVVAV